MKAADISKSIYVTAYRWSYKNFGQGGLPKFNSLFSVSFLMILLLTSLLAIAQLFLNAGWFAVNEVSGIVILFGAAGAMLLNYFVLLNNNRIKKISLAFEKMSKHNQNLWSIMLMVCVMISCVFLMVVSK